MEVQALLKFKAADDVLRNQLQALVLQTDLMKCLRRQYVKLDSAERRIEHMEKVEGFRMKMMVSVAGVKKSTGAVNSAVKKIIYLAEEGIYEQAA